MVPNHRLCVRTACEAWSPHYSAPPIALIHCEFFVAQMPATLPTPLIASKLFRVSNGFFKVKSDLYQQATERAAKVDASSSDFRLGPWVNAQGLFSAPQ
jgi:hypothetical protein